MRLRHLLAPILLLCLTAQAPAPQSKLDAIITRGTIRVGFPGDYRPFALLDKHLHIEGWIDMEQCGYCNRQTSNNAFGLRDHAGHRLCLLWNGEESRHIPRSDVLRQRPPNRLPHIRRQKSRR